MHTMLVSQSKGEAMSDTIVLREVMGTCYIINALLDDFYKVIQMCKDNNLKCDVSLCRFGPDTAYAMSTEYKNVEFINSEEPELNKILINNTEFVKAVYEDYPMLAIPSDVKLDWVVNQIENLPTGQYEPDIAINNIYQRAALCLLIMARPDIEFDIRKYSTDIFTFIRGAWLRDPQHHDSYYELMAPDIFRQDVSEDGLYGSMTGRNMEERDYVGSHMVIPFEFGNSQIVKLGVAPSKEWTPVVTKCVNFLNERATVQQRKRGRTCKNHLTFRGDEKNE